ncbi:hypothetical protein [Methanoculleus frigidifontis]|uniref:hypothetical protein n=1 Tax=Methanoculleus frigidifontis TaxID=2584085 RepID=UPI00265A1233|nr:hypothetical protein [Methanoculleus sp. FWC-SCC1]
MDELLEVELGRVTVTDGARLSYGLLPAGTYAYALTAEDFNGNVAWSGTVAVEMT